MRTVRITVGGAGEPGGSGRRRISLWLLTALASPYRVAFGAGTVTRVWPWQSLSNCQNIGGKIVCTR